VCTYACKEGIRGVPNQQDHVVCYESHKLKKHERNYVTLDLELATIVHALKMWRDYLIWRIFEIRTYHYGLKHLFGQPTLNSKQTRWLEFLTEYDFEIKHIKGKENQVVDALSIRAHEMHISAINMYMIDLKDKILEASNSDKHYLQIKENLQQSNLQQNFKNYELKEDGILLYKGKVYVSNSMEMINTTLREIHNVSYARHLGYHKSITTVRRQYFWLGMKKEVANCIAQCLEC
jgi:hypothetical protein